MDLARHIPLEFDIPLDDPHPTARYTIAQASLGECRFQTHERYGHVQLTIEPYCGAHHYQVVWRVPSVDEDTVLVVSGIHEQYMQSIVLTVQEKALEWQQLRYPMIYVRIAIVGGSFHLVNSSEIGYRIATGRAIIDAVQRVGLRRLD